MRPDSRSVDSHRAGPSASNKKQQPALKRFNVNERKTLMPHMMLSGDEQVHAAGFSSNSIDE